MQRLPFVIIDLAQIVNLGVAVVAGCDTIAGPCGHNLLRLQTTVILPLFRKTRLQETAAAAATKIVRPVGVHVDEVLFPDHRFDHVPQVFGHGVAEGLAHQLAGVLDRKLGPDLLVPVGIDLKLALAEPLGIQLDDALDFKVVFDLEFFESDPDCKKFVPSLGVEPDLTPQIIHGLGLDPYNLFPVLVVGHEQTIVLRGPALGPVGPVGTHRVQDLPQRHHLVRFGHRFTGVLVEEKLGALFVDRGQHLRKFRLGFLVLFQDIFNHELEILLRGTHGATGVVSQGHVARAHDALGPLFARNLGPGVEHQLGDIDLHGADIHAARAHAAPPDPVIIQNLLVHAQGCHAQKLTRIHSLEPGGRAAGRAGPTSQAQVEVTAVRQQTHDMILEGAFTPSFDLENLR